MAVARLAVARPPRRPHFHGPDPGFAAVAKGGHPAGSPVPGIIKRDRGTPELIRTPDSCCVLRLLSFCQNSADCGGGGPCHGLGMQVSIDTIRPSSFSSLSSVQNCLPTLVCCVQEAVEQAGVGGERWRIPAKRGDRDAHRHVDEPEDGRHF